MKTLYLVRHAKSDWQDPSLDDKERPLNERGVQAALMMGERLLVRRQLPEQIMVSSARRALSTVELLTIGWEPGQCVTTVEPRIYDATEATLLSIVNQLDNRYNRVMLVGHNPGMTQFANFLTGDHCADLPTCGVYEARFPLDSWVLVDRNSGYCELFDYPKNDK